MADTIVRAGPTAIDNSDTTLYTCPGSTTALVRVLHVVNDSGADETFVLGINDTGNNILYFNQSVYHANIPFHEPNADIALVSGDTIVANSSASLKLIATLTIVEST